MTSKTKKYLDVGAENLDIIIYQRNLVLDLCNSVGENKQGLQWRRNKKYEENNCRSMKTESVDSTKQTCM